jgi:predicted transglutaminase-like cysteine proteinase
LRLRSATLLAVALFIGAAPPAAARGLFGTHETYSHEIAPFTKWTGAVARAQRERDDPQAFCAALAADRSCPAAWWQDFVAELKTLPLRERVARANAELNRRPYVTAAANWRDPNHWETPFEFLAYGGQCQDYAIAKLMALAQSGVPEGDLRLAVVRDTQKAADHAVAIVFVDGEALVLDNQVALVMPASVDRRYVPYYSINRTGWWYHTPEGGDLVARNTR